MQIKPLDPKAKALLTAIAAAAYPSFDEIPLNTARELFEEGYARMNIPVMPTGAVINHSFTGSGGEIPIRVYMPGVQGMVPVVIFFHGGGWVFNHLDEYDSLCTHICTLASVLVVSVDYRRAPEAKFPAAVNDCFESVSWIAANCGQWQGDSSLIFLVGDSAGGNLATVTAMRIRDEGGPAIKGQLLIYPVTDYYDPEKPSQAEFADGYNMTRDKMIWFWEQYLEKVDDGKNPMASPLRAHDLSHLPPALFLLAGYDIARDEALLYCERLQLAQVPVKLVVYEEMIHGFISFLGILDQAMDAIHDMVSWIKEQAGTV